MHTRTQFTALFSKSSVSGLNLQLLSIQRNIHSHWTFARNRSSWLVVSSKCHELCYKFNAEKSVEAQLMHKDRGSQLHQCSQLIPLSNQTNLRNKDDCPSPFSQKELFSLAHRQIRLQSVAWIGCWGRVLVSFNNSNVQTAVAANPGTKGLFWPLMVRYNKSRIINLLWQV